MTLEVANLSIYWSLSGFLLIFLLNLKEAVQEVRFFLLEA